MKTSQFKRVRVVSKAWIHVGLLATVVTVSRTAHGSPLATSATHRISAQTVAGFGGAATNASGWRLWSSGAQAHVAASGVVTNQCGTLRVDTGFLGTVDWQRFVATVSPRGGTASATETNVVMRLSLGVVAATVDTSNVFLYSDRRGYLDASVLYTTNGNTNQLTVTPARTFLAGERIRVLVLDSIRDIQGNRMRPFGAEFTVAVKSQGGSFADPIDLPGSARNYRQVQLVSWNGTDRLDVVAGSGGTSVDNIMIWTNPPMASPATTLELDNFSGVGFAIADFAREEGRHLLVARDDISHWLRPSQGDADWIDDDYPTAAFAVGDVNLDGHLDLIVVGNAIDVTNRYRVYLGDGAGGFVRQTDHGFPVDKPNPVNVEFGDLNGDGHLDAIICHADAGPVVWINDGNGRFHPREQQWDWTQSDADRARIGDLDGDGRADAVLFSSSAIQVWRNTGEVDFTFGTNINTGVRDITLADVNGSGFLDMVGALGSGGSVNIWTNNGAAAFGLLRTLSAPLGAVEPVLAVGDVDGDGYLDLVVGYGSGGGPLSLWLNVPPPDRPGSLWMWNTDESTVLASWPEAARASWYRVETLIGAANFETDPAVSATNITGTLFQRSNVDSDVHVHARLRAENDSGVSGYIANSLLMSAVPRTAQGIALAWLLDHFPGTTDFGPLTETDTDADGFSVWQEYVADTNPTNSQSYFQVASTNASGEFVIVFPDSSTQRNYWVESRTNLLHGIWVEGDEKVGTGANLHVTPPITSAPAFHRGGVRLP